MGLGIWRRVPGARLQQSGGSESALDHGDRLSRRGTDPCGANQHDGSRRPEQGLYWQIDTQASIAYAATKYRQRDAKVTFDAWHYIDLVEGHQLQLTNPDGSRTFVGIYLHESRLYILESTVPKGAPQPGLFQQSLSFLDPRGKEGSLRLHLLEPPASGSLTQAMRSSEAPAGSRRVPSSSCDWRSVQSQESEMRLTSFGVAVLLAVLSPCPSERIIPTATTR